MDAVKITTRFNDDCIETHVDWPEAPHSTGAIMAEILHLKEQTVQDALVRLGWTPPVKTRTPEVFAVSAPEGLRWTFQGSQDYWCEREDAVQAAHFAETRPDPGNPVRQYADRYRWMAHQGTQHINVWAVIHDLERNIAPLFTALQDKCMRLLGDSNSPRPDISPVGVPIGLEDKHGNPVHIGDTLRFDPHAWGNSTNNEFVVTLQEGEIRLNGVPSDIPEWCEIIHPWDEGDNNDTGARQ